MEIIYICIYIILCTCLFLFAICLFSIFPREICKSLIEKWKCGKRLEWNEILKMKDDLLSISFYEFFPQLFFWCLISLAFLSLEIVSGSKHFEIFQTKFTDVSWLCERTSSQNTLIIVVTEHCIIQIHNIQYNAQYYTPHFQQVTIVHNTLTPYLFVLILDFFLHFLISTIHSFFFSAYAFNFFSFFHLLSCRFILALPLSLHWYCHSFSSLFFFWFHLC